MTYARSVFLVICFSAVVLTSAAAAGENGKSRPRKGALAGLPSAPGPHVAKIKAMGNRSWLSLGAPKPDSRWGPAPGRAYTNKMTYAPDLAGGFLFGEGVHGARGTGPRKGYYNDDVFFYDLMAHRYVCIWPGTDTSKPVKYKVDKNGFCAAEDGQNYPVAIAVHGYECQSYNPETGEFMTLLTGSPYSKGIGKQLPVQGKGSLRDRKKNSKHPYFYSTYTGRWERRKVAGAGPRAHFCKTLRYIPSKKQTVYYSRPKTLYFYDHAANKWSKPATKGTPPTAGKEGSTAYDSKRDRLYLFNSSEESIPAVYEFKTSAFSILKAKNQPYPPSNGYAKGLRVLSSTSSNSHYDPVADVVVMRLRVKQGSGDPRNIRAKTLGLAIYDCEKNEWEKSFVPLPKEAQRKACWNSCYSPELNVHVYHLAGDSRANGTVVLYRHKRRAP